MEEKKNNPESTSPTLGINQIFQQQPCIPAFELNNMHYYQGSNSQESFNQANQVQSPSSSYLFSDQLSIPKPFYHSPQSTNVSNTLFEQMKITHRPFNSPQLQPYSKHSAQSHQQNQTFPQQHLKQNLYTQCNLATSNFENKYLISPQNCPVSNKNNDLRERLEGMSGSSYFQQLHLGSTFTSKNVSNYNNKFKQNQQFNNYANHYSSPPIQSMKSKLRKQSFNSSSSTSSEDSMNYQFRARAGSYQSSIPNNHFNNPTKKKQIEERIYRKVKKPIKHNQKQHFNAQNSRQNENVKQIQTNEFGLEDINHNWDNNRITNEDLIARHQEQMKEEQNQSNKQYDELNISEKEEEEQDNLEEITLLSTHRHNYGCSMIDRIILDESSNEDESKVEKAVSAVFPSHSQNIESFGDLECQKQISQQISTNIRGINKQSDSKNSQICSNKMNQESWIKYNSNIYEQYNSKQSARFVHQQVENSKTNEGSEENIISSEITSHHQIDIEEQSIVSLAKIQNVENSLNSQNNLNNLLEQANQNMENPQTLYQIVQKLAKQVLEKDQTIKNMESENSLQINKIFKFFILRVTEDKFSIRVIQFE